MELDGLDLGDGDGLDSGACEPGGVGRRESLAGGTEDRHDLAEFPRPNRSGKPVAFVPVSAEQYGQGLAAAGLPPFVVDAVLSIQHMWSVGGFDGTTGDVERLSGRPPRSLTEVMRRAFAPPTR